MPVYRPQSPRAGGIDILPDAHSDIPERWLTGEVRNTSFPVKRAAGWETPDALHLVDAFHRKVGVLEVGCGCNSRSTPCFR